MELRCGQSQSYFNTDFISTDFISYTRYIVLYSVVLSVTQWNLILKLASGINAVCRIGWFLLSC